MKINIFNEKPSDNKWKIAFIIISQNEFTKVIIDKL